MVEFSPGAIQIPDPEASFIDAMSAAPMNGNDGQSLPMHGGEEATYVSAIPNIDAMDGSFDFSQKHALFQQFKKDVTGSTTNVGNDSFAITSTKDGDLLELHTMRDDLEALSLTPFNPETVMEVGGGDGT